jgi:hypothetical protein
VALLTIVIYNRYMFSTGHSVTRLSSMICHDTQNNGTKLKGTYRTGLYCATQHKRHSVRTLNVYDECRIFLYAECHHAEYLYA